MSEAATRDDLDFGLWKRLMDVDLNGPMLMCKAFLPLMRGLGWGRVVNVTSVTVAIASPVSIAYHTARMGVIGFTRALSATLGDEGITINAVLLSLTRTAMTEGLPEEIVHARLGRQVIHAKPSPPTSPAASSSSPLTRPVGSPVKP